MFRKITGLLIAAFIVALALSGCGGSSKPAEQPKAAEPAKPAKMDIILATTTSTQERLPQKIIINNLFLLEKSDEAHVKKKKKWIFCFVFVRSTLLKSIHI